MYVSMYYELIIIALVHDKQLNDQRWIMYFKMSNTLIEFPSITYVCTYVIKNKKKKTRVKRIDMS